MPSGYMAKGQWFLISAVVISGALLTISVLFRDYFIADASKVALIDEDFYFNDIKFGMKDILANHCPSNSDGARNFKEFIEFSRQKMQEKGYIFEVACRAEDCPINCAQSLQYNFPLILMKSGRMEAWEGNRPEIGTFEFSFNPANSEFRHVDINFKKVEYDFYINASIFHNVSSRIMIASAIKKINKGSDSIKFTASDFSLNNVYRNDIMHATASSTALVGETEFYP